jgi:hypothetical protein
MATKQTSSKRSSGSKRRSDTRSASQKPEKYRFAQNVDGEETVPEREYRTYAAEAREGKSDDPDVLLDVPVVKVDSIHLEVENLEAQVSLQAKVLELLELDVGVEVHLGKLKIDIKGVEAQALLKVRLDHVSAIVDRVMTTLDRNPELVESIGRAVEQVGEGAGHTLEEAGEAAEEVGEGAEQAAGQIGEGAGQAVGELGEGAGQAVGQLGEDAGQAVGQVGEGAGQAVDQLGEGAGEAVGQVGEGAGQAVGNPGEAVGNIGQQAGQAAEGVGQAAGGAGEAAGQAAEGVGQAAGGAGEAVGETAGGLGEAAGGLLEGGGNGGGLDIGEVVDEAGNVTTPKLAKAAAKTAVKEIGQTASEEAKEIGVAATLKATEKVKQFGKRRRRKRAEKHHATPAAVRVAGELDVDLDEVEGSGAEGRITVNDVREWAEEE